MSSGTVAIWAMKDNDYGPTEFAGTTAGLQAAIDYLAGGKGKVFIGPGTLSLTSAFYVTSNMTLEASGAGATVIQRGTGMLGTVLLWDNGAAVSNVVIRGITFDNDSLAVTTRDINLVNGAANVLIENCRWINLTNRVGDLVRFSTGASAGSNIKIIGNTVIGPGSQQTYNSFQVFDCSQVDVSGNYIEGWGAIKVEGSASDTFNWSVCRNRFKAVDQTNVFTRIQNAVSVSSVVVADNVAVDCGKAFLACDAVNASDTGLIRDVTISGNTVRGFGASLLDDAIQVGGVVTSGTFYCTNVSVVGNSINGLKADGTMPTTAERGISVEAGTQYVSVYANAVRNCGRSGIGVGASDCVVAGNVVERCVRRDTSGTPPTSTQEGGIATFGNSVYACQNVQIIGNLCKNNGVDGTTTSQGITISRNNTGTTATHNAIGNRCYDDQGTKTQAYGIAVGSAAGVSANNSQISGNDVRGNATAGLLFQGTATGVSFADNVDATATTIASAATISIPLNGDVFHVTGTTNITNGITVNNYDIRRTVKLIFDDIVTVTDTGTSKLQGNFTSAAEDVLCLTCDGTNWYEVSRN